MCIRDITKSNFDIHIIMHCRSLKIELSLLMCGLIKYIWKIRGVEDCRLILSGVNFSYQEHNESQDGAIVVE